MGDYLGVAIVALDNDDIPHWFEWTLPKITGFILGKAASLALGPEADTVGSMIGEELGKAYVEWLGSAEDIGTHIKRYSREQGWGADKSATGTVRHYDYRAKNMRVRYQIDYIESPRKWGELPGRQVEVYLNPIRIHDDGDSWPKGKGDIFVYSRVCDGFRTVSSGKMLLWEIVFRMPNKGTADKDDGDSFGTSWPRNGKLIFRGYEPGPFLFVEVGVWDADSPNSGDDHDMLGIFSDWLIIPDQPGTYRMRGTRQGVDEGKVTVDILVNVMDEIR